MTGFRVGWLRAPEQVISVGNNVIEAFSSSGVAFSQAAAANVLTGDQTVVANMRQAYQGRRDLACNILQQHGLLSYTPSGAFYILVDISNGRKEGESSTDFTLRLLDSTGVAVAPGGTFGRLADSYVRISLASDEETLQIGCQRLCEFITAA